MKTTLRKIYIMIGTCVMPAATYAATGAPVAIGSSRKVPAKTLR